MKTLVDCYLRLSINLQALQNGSQFFMYLTVKNLKYRGS